MNASAIVPGIEAEDLRRLAATPGTLRVEVAELDAVYVPIVYFSANGTAPELLGVIIEAGGVLHGTTLNGTLQRVHALTGDFDTADMANDGNIVLTGLLATRH
ncbi:hypothetical protein [Eleftheria terrae]|uniref:hypothetical protein n=1 Tax=Eleftheria terrae TaxID=1597781 RepID=UPI00263A40BC|nr:hypothetical protein [Eleftheria terrae]WKB50521.1 hypothetical protein N7L95_00295 [Eleftheria terrae]